MVFTILKWDSPEDHGAIGDGVTDDTAAFQAALNSGLNVAAMQLYAISSSLVMSTNGQSLLFGNRGSSGLQGTAGSTADLLRVGLAQKMSVEGGALYTNTGQIGIRVYCSNSKFRDISIGNRQAGSGNGTGILLTDQDPVTGTCTYGRYNNTFDGLTIGYAGYSYAFGIDSNSSYGGQQANKFKNMTVAGNCAIRLEHGGGNTYSGNLFQSDTGSSSNPLGYCLDLGANVAGEMIYGNYFENYQYATYLRNASNAYLIANVYNNHYDDVTGVVGLANSSITNYLAESTPPMGVSTYTQASGGTSIGNMTGGGGLAAAADGDFSKTQSNCAQHQTSFQAGTWGYHWNAPKTITQFKVWGSSDYGYDTGADSPYTFGLVLQGSNDGSTWTTLFNSSPSDVKGTDALTFNKGINTSTAYQYHQIVITGYNSAWPTLCQGQFFTSP